MGTAGYTDTTPSVSHQISSMSKSNEYDQDEKKMSPTYTAQLMRHDGAMKIECMGEMAIDCKSEDEIYRPLQGIVAPGGMSVEHVEVEEDAAQKYNEAGRSGFNDKTENATCCPLSSRGNLIMNAGVGREERWRGRYS